jgi:hypothetical protein
MGMLVIIFTFMIFSISFLWKIVVSDIFIGDLVPSNLTFFQSIKLVVFLCIFATAVASFYHFTKRIKELKRNNFIKAVLIGGTLAIISMVSGFLIFFMWGWIVNDLLINAVSGNIIGDQINILTSIGVCLVFFVVLISDDLISMLFFVLRINQR